MSRMNLVGKHIRRSPYQSISAIVLTTITFFIVSVFALTALGAHALLTYFESRPQVTAFFDDSATSAQIDNLQKELDSSVDVETATYISKDQALEIYREQNQDNPLLLEMVTADILPASLEVSTKTVAELDSVAALMQDQPFVEEVVFQKDVIDTLASWVRGVRWGGIALSGLLLFASLTTIVIILGLKFTARKHEINTLALLGATNGYIRGPFVVEGIIYAITGAVFGWGLAYLLLLYLTPNLVGFLREISLLPVPYYVMLSLLGGQILLGLVLGSLASLIATRRYGR